MPRRQIFLSFGLITMLLWGFPAAPKAAIFEQIGHYTGWPTDAEWLKVPSLDDGDDGLVRDHLDFVGNTAYPGFYKANMNSGYIFFRIRVDFDGPVTIDTFSDSVIVVIDYNSDGTEDYGFAWDSKSGNNAQHGLELQIKDLKNDNWAATRLADLDGSSGQKLAVDINGGGRSTDGYIRTVDAIATGAGNFGNTTFIDFAVSCSYLQTNTALRCSSQSWSLQIASIANATDHNPLSYDVGSYSSPSATPRAWSNPAPALVELRSFEAMAAPDRILIHWQTAAEIDTAGFHLWRATDPTGQYVRLTDTLIPARGSSMMGADYVQEDPDVIGNQPYFYLLEDIDTTGLATRHGPVSASRLDIQTTSPENGAVLAGPTPPEFSWNGPGFRRFQLEFAADPQFISRCFKLPAKWRQTADTTPLWLSQSGYTPTPAEWWRLKGLAQDRQLYWRVYGEDDANHQLRSPVAQFRYTR
jgi:hypothetical protein